MPAPEPAWLPARPAVGWSVLAADPVGCGRPAAGSTDRRTGASEGVADAEGAVEPTALVGPVAVAVVGVACVGVAAEVVGRVAAVEAAPVGVLRLEVVDVLGAGVAERLRAGVADGLAAAPADAVAVAPDGPVEAAGVPVPVAVAVSGAGAECGAATAAALAESAATAATAADVGATERRTRAVGSEIVPVGRKSGRASVRRIALASGRWLGAAADASAEPPIGEPANKEIVATVDAFGAVATSSDAWPMDGAALSAALAASPESRLPAAGASSGVGVAEPPGAAVAPGDVRRRTEPRSVADVDVVTGAAVDAEIPTGAVVVPGARTAAGVEPGVATGAGVAVGAGEDEEPGAGAAVGPDVDAGAGGIDRLTAVGAGGAAEGDGGAGRLAAGGVADTVGRLVADPGAERRTVADSGPGRVLAAAVDAAADRAGEAVAAARRASADAVARARRRRRRPDGAGGGVPGEAGRESVAAEGARSPVTADDARPDPPSFPGRAGGSALRGGALRITRESELMVILPLARTSSETRTGIVFGARRAVDAPGR